MPHICRLAHSALSCIWQSFCEHTISDAQKVIEVRASFTASARTPVGCSAAEFCGRSPLSEAVPQSSDANPTPVQVLKQFPFSSALQRMSVLVRDGSSVYTFVKGSPEVIAARCRLGSRMCLRFTVYGVPYICVCDVNTWCRMYNLHSAPFLHSSLHIVMCTVIVMADEGCTWWTLNSLFIEKKLIFSSEKLRGTTGEVHFEWLQSDCNGIQAIRSVNNRASWWSVYQLREVLVYQSGNIILLSAYLNYKVVNIPNCPLRELVASELCFIGLLIFENRLKTESSRLSKDFKTRWFET